MRARQTIIWILALGFLVWLPTSASAQNVTLSGKHKMFCCTGTPPAPIFVQPAYGAPAGYWTAFYTNLGFPTSTVVHTSGSAVTTVHPATTAAKGLVKIGPANVTASGVSNKTLMIGYGQITAMTTNPSATPNTPKFVSLSTVLNWKNAAGTLAAGGSWPAAFAGASTWSFCPKSIGPGTPLSGGCSKPARAGVPLLTHTAGSTTTNVVTHTSGSATTTVIPTSNRNGRILRKAGANKFGGTMNLLGGNVTTLKRFAVATYIPVYLVGSNIIRNTPIGGKATSGGVPSLSGTVTTWPLQVGPLFTHTSGSTTIGPFYAPNPAQMEFFGAGPWGTGSVGIQITANQQAPLTKISWNLKGYDYRNASGYGNLQLVSGVMYNGLNVNGSVTLGNRLTLTLPEPGPALGVAAGALALAGLGWIRVRRRHRG